MSGHRDSPVVRGARMDSAISQIAAIAGAANGWGTALTRELMPAGVVDDLTKEQRQLLHAASASLMVASYKLDRLRRELENERR